MLISLGSSPQINVQEANIKTGQAHWPMAVMVFFTVLVAGVVDVKVVLQVGWISAQRKWVDDNDWEKDFVMSLKYIFEFS